jgi:hypothetical protein
MLAPHITSPYGQYWLAGIQQERKLANNVALTSKRERTNRNSRAAFGRFIGPSGLTTVIVAKYVEGCW